MMITPPQMLQHPKAEYPSPTSKLLSLQANSDDDDNLNNPAKDLRVSTLDEEAFTEHWTQMFHLLLLINLCIFLEPMAVLHSYPPANWDKKDFQENAHGIMLLYMHSILFSPPSQPYI